ncbi:GNAT family N-acetyltransferase [Muricoccus pecuniae]|uniref:RimJ/RimL family protein N-acetyltransferase n=1 Tax=Muricoccus pecuniae TaxID=693023 RepID=A0A840Y255_9PROT|nr:GNAT family N-acetyltransferase [Roseomonas pecuniae]MBB5692889.1 RimJ/RimL family protein N-acetyltransferase [Roseomonas pecuniae]
MAVERSPGHDAFINRWTEAEHGAALAGPSHAYLVALGAGSAPAGFAILSDLTDAHGNTCLKRVAMAEPGRGLGARFLRAVADHAFTGTAAHRLWLHVLASNARARHVYAALGFAEEGRLRGAHLGPGGERTDLLLLSFLRAEWEAGREAPVNGARGD